MLHVTVHGYKHLPSLLFLFVCMWIKFDAACDSAWV